jgi:hypothetical protein
MKIQEFLFLIVLLIGMTNCKKNENVNIDTGINFCTNEKISDIIVKYDEIIGYDSTKYIFRVNESAWNRLKDEISPSSPDPHFGFDVALNNQIIYTAKYIPGYYSMSYHDIVTFMLAESNLVYMTLGYPHSPVLFTGEDLRNDLKLINQLKKDNKLIEIED